MLEIYRDVAMEMNYVKMPLKEYSGDRYAFAAFHPASPENVTYILLDPDTMSKWRVTDLLALSPKERDIMEDLYHNDMSISRAKETIFEELVCEKEENNFNISSLEEMGSSWTDFWN